MNTAFYLIYQGLTGDHTRAWCEIASRLGGRSRQGLVDDRVKAWRRIASRLGVVVTGGCL